MYIRYLDVSHSSACAGTMYRRTSMMLEVGLTSPRRPSICSGGFHRPARLLHRSTPPPLTDSRRLQVHVPDLLGASPLDQRETARYQTLHVVSQCSDLPAPPSPYHHHTSVDPISLATTRGASLRARGRACPPTSPGMRRRRRHHHHHHHHHRRGCSRAMASLQ